MEQHSQVEDTAKSRKVLESQLRECYGRVVYTHKTHEKCADILFSRLGRIKFWQIVLSALTTCGFAGTIFTDAKVLGIAGAAISTILLVLNSYTKDYDLGTVAQQHRQTANELWLIRERYLSLLTDLALEKKPLSALLEERDILMSELHTLYAAAPSTMNKAYREAQQALKVREDMTFSEAEIDALLPESLRRS